MSKFTAKTIHLYGDKTKAIEPAQHIITFPGGSVEVSRCEDGTYWAHIARDRGQSAEADGGVFLDGRTDSDSEGVYAPVTLEDKGIYHVAIRIGMAARS